MTTQQKIRAAEAAAKAKGPQSAKPGASQLKAAGHTGPGKLMQAVQTAGAPPKKTAKMKPPGMMSVLHSQNASMQKFAKKEGKNEVMYRRTKRAEKYLRGKKEQVLSDPELKAMLGDQKVQEALSLAKRNDKVWERIAQKKNDKGVQTWEKIVKLAQAGLIILPDSVDIGGCNKHQDEVFRLMDLPKELRAEIFKLVVVEDKVFIRPDSETGREQPDLAMVSRQVRAEVLPVFYGKNVFAIDLSPTGPIAKLGRPRCDKSGPVTGLAAIKDWSSELEKGEWFGKIRYWVFDYAPPGAWVTGQHQDIDVEDGSLMVSVNFSKKQRAMAWDAVVEVHREAACVMSGFDQHDSCKVKRVPEWLNEAVIRVLDAAKSGSISGGMIVGLTQTIRAKVHELGKYRCE